MKKLFFLGFLFVGMMACQEQVEYIGPLTNCDLSSIPYNPISYRVIAPQGLPPMEYPADNPFTVQGIELGRHLFYDPILSRDSTISCSSCHNIQKAFTDGLAKAKGIDGRMGKRSSMPLINVGYHWIRRRKQNFMWDGRFATLEQQVLEGAILDPLEMDNTWENVEAALRQHPTYPKMFREAFGINCPHDINRVLVAKAIAQFERTLNAADSKYDKFIRGGSWVYLSSEENNGRDLFFGTSDNGPAKDAGCEHCHRAPDGKSLFASADFFNNGLDSAATLLDFSDYGYGLTTGNAPNNGQFRAVTLRNIALTAPYMHDGRFQTLEEVLDHYVTGGHPAPNLASELTDTTHILQQLTASQKADLVAFLHTLTDSSYFHKPEWNSPF